MDNLIIGAGPAGLQVGYSLSRAGVPYRILEASGTAGCFFERYPRHRRLISANKVHTGRDGEINYRWDWNSLLTDGREMPFAAYSEDFFPPADAMVRYLRDFARRYRLDIEYGCRATRVHRGPDGFTVVDQRGREHRCSRLIVCTGMSEEHVAAIPGIEHATTYGRMSLDQARYTGKRVLIIGKGNSAFETADHLTAHAAVIHMVSPHKVSLAWQTHFAGNLRAVNAAFLDTYQLKLQHASLDANVLGIRRRSDGLAVGIDFLRATERERTEIVYDHVIACTGFRFSDQVFDDTCRPELTLDDRFPAQDSGWQSANVPDLHFAGTLSQVRDFRRASSSFIEGFRFNAAVLARLILHRHYGRPLPSRPVTLEPRRLAGEILDRFNRTAALWDQFGYLADAIVLADDRPGTWLHELPADHLGTMGLDARRGYLQLTFEFGSPGACEDPLAISRPSQVDATKGSLSPFIHPVIRHVVRGEVVAEHHVLENLDSHWDDDHVHQRPLIEFLESVVLSAGVRGS